jgi:hypothetical protein
MDFDVPEHITVGVGLRFAVFSVTELRESGMHAAVNSCTNHDSSCLEAGLEPRTYSRILV